ncbi:hypothetical protein [Bifidobacterium myosotis]|uniref:Uncharacterized protein n=1 Tax=Bifidobacterium myosotis TaxID=1630166 RepID=A0A5M9ZHW5_9BIFI|nr:hypothetical protein [Bifidobacterium myosotis]KAA8827204.1 hypothetical protein EMO91_09125 [Bifidobacterium myosotis]
MRIIIKGISTSFDRSYEEIAEEQVMTVDVPAALCEKHGAVVGRLKDLLDASWIEQITSIEVIPERKPVKEES